MFSEEKESLLECATCGHPGTPNPECGICHGNAATQSRAYTLSEESAQRKSDPNRYSRSGAVGPKIINLPGSGLGS